ncbi:DNA-binding anti-repressor SinI [Bacillaceae bacterium W0354]
MKQISVYNKGLRKLADREWVMLKKEAKQHGINKQEIRTFLQKNDPEQL